MCIIRKIWPIMAAIALLGAIYGCHSVKTGRSRDIGGKPHVEVRRQAPGLPFLYYTAWNPVPSKADETRNTLRAPARWLLWVAMPIAIISFALTLVSQAPPVQKLGGTISVVAGLCCAGATAWLLATTYMWLLVVALVGAAAALMYNYKDKGILFRCQTKN